MDKTNSGEFSISQSVYYSLPIFLTSLLLFPLISITPGIYAKYFGLSLGVIATVVTVAKLVDAITDPLIGYYSDRYKEKRGTRKPWLVVGSLGFLVSSYFLYSPPENVSAGYFLAFFCLTYLAWTIVEVPHLAWGGELISSSHDKTRIYSVRTFFQFLGTLAFMAIPLLPFLKGQGFTPETLQWSVIFCAVIALPLVTICVKSVPDGKFRAPPVKKASRELFIKSFIQNKPLLILLTGMLFSGTSSGVFLGINFIYADSYLGLGENLPTIYTIGVVISLLAIPLVYSFSRRFEKATIWVAGQFAFASVIAAHGLLAPGPSTLILFTILLTAQTFIAAVLNCMYPSILSDIGDYGRWKFGSDRTATYFSAYLFIGKATIGIGSGIGLAIANWYGFDPKDATHSEEGIFGLKIAAAYLPGLLGCMSLYFFAKLPLNERRHNIISKRLESRERQTCQPENPTKI